MYNIQFFLIESTLMEEAMNEQEDFFSPQHKQLLNIAAWAKYLAWVVLVINIFYAIGVYFNLPASP